MRPRGSQTQITKELKAKGSKSDTPTRRQDYLFKYRILGDKNSGATSLLLRYAEGKDYTDLDMERRYGIDFKMVTSKVGNETVKAQIWDKTDTSKYERATHSYIVTYDLTNKDSFAAAVKAVKDLQKKYDMDEKFVIALVGTKADLTDKRKISSQDIEAAVGSLGTENIVVVSAVTSSKTGQGISELFDSISRRRICLDNPEKAAELLPPKQESPKKSQATTEISSLDEMKVKVKRVQEQLKSLTGTVDKNDEEIFKKVERRIDNLANYKPSPGESIGTIIEGFKESMAATLRDIGKVKFAKDSTRSALTSAVEEVTGVLTSQPLRAQPEPEKKSPRF